VISDASSWVFRGTDLNDGSSLTGVIASDFDHVIAGSPSNVEILAHSRFAPAKQPLVVDVGRRELLGHGVFHESHE